MKKMVIGLPYKGTIVFSSVGSVVFYLNSYDNANDVRIAIQAIPYHGDTPDARLLSKLRFHRRTWS